MEINELEIDQLEIDKLAEKLENELDKQERLLRVEVPGSLVPRYHNHIMSDSNYHFIRKIKEDSYVPEDLTNEDHYIHQSDLRDCSKYWENNFKSNSRNKFKYFTDNFE